MVLGDTQRAVAYGILSLLCAAWAVLGVAGIVTAYGTPVGMDGTGGYLALVAVVGAGLVLTAVAALGSGIKAIRRIDRGRLRWRTAGVVTGVGCAASVWAAVMVLPALPVLGALLAIQAVALLSLAVALRPVPAPSRGA